MNLPQEFTDRMKKMLGEEYPAFLANYDKPRLRGLRVNTTKITPEEFEANAPFPVKRIPWVPNGFFYDNDTYPAQHPWYAAGVYYLQEPSAMTPASRLPIEAGMRVLDMCAAPGGKATELAARLHGTGVLVANDISNSRAKALLRNLELFGTPNAYVTNEIPNRLSQAFPAYFDRILVDAPCSGEGMFRKDEDVIGTWSPERVEYFAAQQRNILENAHAMLKADGYLLYSTCTFSPDEDEQMMAWFTTAFPDMELCEIEPYEGFSEGRPDWANNDPELAKCVRIWPHKMDGEGHFLALLHKKAEGAAEIGASRIGVPEDGAAADSADSTLTNSVLTASTLTASTLTDRALTNSTLTDSTFEESGRRKNKKAKGKNRDGRFSGRDGRDRRSSGTGRGGDPNGMDREHKELLEQFFAGSAPSFGEERGFEGIECRSDHAYLVPDLPASIRGLTFLRNGLYVGDWKKKRFEPSQPLALALRAEDFGNAWKIDPSDERMSRYLRGETIELTDADSVQAGWCLVCAGNYPVGWGKCTGGIVKNKYAVSWRKNN
ncbi:MAG: RsmB/NOP family class I SAM-dependent RNA methyltransferase [Eubacterium sp.]|nr:RsmB/NOP family class I SAM-dependent RNA methyltransferase [Eubacterium sp.]